MGADERIEESQKLKRRRKKKSHVHIEVEDHISRFVPILDCEVTWDRGFQM